MARFPARRIALLLMTLTVAATCVRLGFWQLDRLEQRRSHNSVVSARLASPLRPLDALLGVATPPQDLAYLRVEVTGTYDPDHEVTLYGRPLEGRPGDHVLTPLVIDDGTAVVVDRGWVPIRDGAQPGMTSPPSGPVTVRGFLIEPEASTHPEEGDPTPETVARLDLTLIGKGLPYDLAPVALQLTDQVPPQSSGLPVPAPEPKLDEGPHLSYAVQWFSFAAIAVIGYVVLEVRERRRT